MQTRGSICKQQSASRCSGLTLLGHGSGAASLSQGVLQVGPQAHMHQPTCTCTAASSVCERGL